MKQEKHEGVGIIVVGATRTGKTTYVKERLKHVPKNALMIYDVNNEYGEFYNRPFVEFEQFTNEVEHMKNGVIVLEEATIFLSNRSCNKKIQSMLVRKRHNKIVVFMNFHSLRTIPRYIYDLSNYIVVHRTNDSIELIDRKFEDERLTAMCKRVAEQSVKNPHYNEILQIY